MKKTILYTALGLLITISACRSGLLGFDYKGEPYTSQNRNIQPHIIPGKIQCEHYDIGGENVAFHDTDVVNNGSGKLNKGNDYLDIFRMNESVDISYTKFHDSIDNSAFNVIQPLESQLYVGWTEPGEWVNYTVDVRKAGVFKVGVMYTCNGDGQISLHINNQDKTGAIQIPSTHNNADQIKWRQWHHWNYQEGIAEITLSKGIQVLTLHILKNGQMNFDFISFTRK